MKIAIFPGYGSNCYTDFMIDALNNSDKYERATLADVLEALPITHEEINQKDYNEFEHNNKEYIKDKEGQIYLKSNTGHVCRVKLVEVATSQPWRINDYDGAESIEYFKGVEYVDKEIGLAEW